MRALIIGADGFAGRWLTRHLVESGDTVVAGVGPRFSEPVPLADQVERVDVRNLDSVQDLVRLARPEVSFYLAGVAHRGGREALVASAEVSVTGSLHALLALSEHARGATLVFVSSGFVYPASPAAHAEDSACAPADTYGATKLAAEGTLRQLAQRAGIELVIARPFNHIGPGQRVAFLVPTIAKQLREVADGRTTQVTVGTTTDVRDFSDVRDVVQGYRLLATAGQAGATYNVASGRGHVVAEVIDLMIRIAGVRADIVAESPPGPSGPTALIGDSSALRSLGWTPSFTLEESLRDVLAEYMPEGWQSPTLTPTAG